MYGRSPTASLRCSAAVVPEGGGCQCHRRSSWRRACWSIFGGSDVLIARPVRGDPGAMPAERIEKASGAYSVAGRPCRGYRLTVKQGPPSYVKVTHFHNVDNCEGVMPIVAKLDEF